VPFPAGGTADVLPRALAERISARLGQSVLIENRAGAAGNIGAELVYKAEPDGYTFLAAPPPPLVINPSLYAKLAHDPTQMVPVGVMAAVPNVLLVHPKVAANTMQEFIAFVKANPDKLNYASQGSGTTSHLTAELFKSMAGVRITHVPYKGTAPALTDLLAGQVEVMFDNLGVSLQHVKSGKLKALAIGSEKRVSSLPGVPTVAEAAGLPGFEFTPFYAIVTQGQTPRDIVNLLSASIGKALSVPELRDGLLQAGTEPGANTPEQMLALAKHAAGQIDRIVKASGIKGGD